MRNNFFINWFKVVGFSQAILAGVFLGVGFVWPLLWWTSFLGIVWCVHILVKTPATKKVLTYFFIVWFIKYLFGLVWFFSTYPIEWIGIGSGVAQISLIIFYWMTSAMWLALGGVICAFILSQLLKVSVLPKLLWYLLIPTVWLFGELAGPFLFSIFTAGPGSLFQSYFSFGMSGYLLGYTMLGIFLAGGLGVYGLSLVISALGVGLYYGVKVSKNTNRFFTVTILSLTACVLLIHFAQAPYKAGNTTVIGVDTTFRSSLFKTKDGFAIKEVAVAEAVEVAMALSPTAVLLPEDSRYGDSQFDMSVPKQAFSYFQFLFHGTETLLVDSGRATTPTGETILRAHIFDGVNQKVWQFDKQYLVPQGEYVPYLYSSLLRLLGYGQIINKIAIDSAYQPGPSSQTSGVSSNVPGVLFCFESVRPGGVLALENTRPLPFIAHPISHAWFHTPQILWRQLDVMLKIQARQSGLPIVSAGNMTPGKLYLPDGTIESGEVVGEGEYYTLRLYRF